MDEPRAEPVSPPRRSPVPVAAAAVLLALASGVLIWTLRPPQAPALLPDFDLDTAMSLAGAQVPAGVESFYFFVLDRATPGEADELAEKLVVAAGEHEFLGITGADPAHNRSVLLSALRIDRGRSLSGLVLIYVGPAEQEAELTPLVNETGAEFRYVVYTPPAPDAI